LFTVQDKDRKRKMDHAFLFFGCAVALLSVRCVRSREDVVPRQGDTWAFVQGGEKVGC
jgi:hypothetical protein